MTRYHSLEMTAMQNEPVMTGATVLAAVGAVLTLLIAFGVDISTDQRAAIIGLVTVVAPVLVGWIVRSKVTPAP